LGLGQLSPVLIDLPVDNSQLKSLLQPVASSFYSPSLGISPSSILASTEGQAFHTTNFSHQHSKVAAMSSPSNATLQERLKGDTVVLGSPAILPSFPVKNMPDLKPSITLTDPSGRNTKFSEYVYVEKSGISDGDFEFYNSNFKSEDQSIVDKKPSIENLLLCDEEDTMTPKMETVGRDNRVRGSVVSSGMGTPQLIQGDDMDEDEDEDEDQHLIIDEADSTSPQMAKQKLSTIKESKREQVSNLSRPIRLNIQINRQRPFITVRLETFSGSILPPSSLASMIMDSPSIVTEKPKKRSSALNRMRGNINVWVPFSECEEEVLCREIARQVREKNLRLVDQQTSKPISPVQAIPSFNQSPKQTTPRSTVLLPSPIPVHSVSPRLAQPSELSSINSLPSDYVDNIDFVEILTSNSSLFHPLRTPVSLRSHFLKLREHLGDVIITDEKGIFKTPQALYQKENSHAWLSSSKQQAKQEAASTPSGRGRKKKVQTISDSPSIVNTSSGRGRKRKTVPPTGTVPVGGSTPSAPVNTTQQLPNPVGIASTTMASLEPIQKKTKRVHIPVPLHTPASLNSLPTSTIETLSSKSSSITFLLLLDSSAAKGTKQIQPSKVTLPLSTKMKDIADKIKTDLSLTYVPEIICEGTPLVNNESTIDEVLQEFGVAIDELVLNYK